MFLVGHLWSAVTDAWRQRPQVRYHGIWSQIAKRWIESPKVPNRIKSQIAAMKIESLMVKSNSVRRFNLDLNRIAIGICPSLALRHNCLGVRQWPWWPQPWPWRPWWPQTMMATNHDCHSPWPWRPQTMTTNLVKFIQRCYVSLTVHLVLVFHVFIAVAIVVMVCGRHGIRPMFVLHWYCQAWPCPLN